jgi:hypothetical protein
MAKGTGVPKRPDVRIGRHYWNNVATAVTVPISTALSTPVEFRDWAGGILYAPSDIASVNLTATTVIAFKVCSTQNGTYLPLYDKTGVLVEIVVSLTALRAYPLPDELFGAGWFEIWTEASGSDVVQAAAHSFTISLKG